ncbi:MAG: GTP cyclohydrolase I FolE2, partial [Spirochaeta sp.]
FALSASLDSHHRGTHMSRFIEQLQAVYQDISLISWNRFPEQIASVLEALRADTKVRFALFREVSAPHTKKVGMQAADIQLLSRWTRRSGSTLNLRLSLPVATVCPCSREISERGAHNQRGTVTVSGTVAQQRLSELSLLDTVTALEGCASVPLYPLLKRSDEKLVTEQGYDHAKFVEDVARDVVLLTRELNIFSDFTIEVENQESIHTHNAFAIIQEAVG